MPRQKDACPVNTVTPSREPSAAPFTTAKRRSLWHRGGDAICAVIRLTVALLVASLMYLVIVVTYLLMTARLPPEVLAREFSAGVGRVSLHVYARVVMLHTQAQDGARDIGGEVNEFFFPPDIYEVYDGK